MLICDLKELEKIVENNPNLHWDGWNVVHIKQQDDAQYSAQGVFNRDTGKWYTKQVYCLDGIGWDIPNEVITHEK